MEEYQKIADIKTEHVVYNFIMSTANKKKEEQTNN